jgi:hypothetical protein
MWEMLEGLDWAAMPNEGKLRGAMAEQSFKLGLSTKVLGMYSTRSSATSSSWASAPRRSARTTLPNPNPTLNPQPSTPPPTPTPNQALGKNNGPYEPTAYQDGMGVWDGASVARKHGALWAAASELIAAVCPEYHWTTVSFNKNFGTPDGQGRRSGARHRDDKDSSHQVAMALGDYEGGYLRVYGTHGVTDVDTRNRWARFDGRYSHEVRPYLGTRYSVVYFQLVPPWDIDPTSLI